MVPVFPLWLLSSSPFHIWLSTAHLYLRLLDCVMQAVWHHREAVASQHRVHTGMLPVFQVGCADGPLAYRDRGCAGVGSARVLADYFCRSLFDTGEL